MTIDLTFASGYDLEVLDELPGTPNPVQFYFPPLRSEGRDGTLLRIKPDRSQKWVGCFAFGSYELSACIASPEPRQLFVLSRGAGYAVDVDCPGKSRELPSVPVRDFRVLADQKMVLFADFTRTAAYGVNGLIWRSERLCWDDVKILSIEGGLVYGSGSDPTSSANPERRWELDLLTGRTVRTDFPVLP